MEFDVHPPTLRSCGDAFVTIGSTLPAAHTYTAHLAVPPDAHQVLASIHESVAQARGAAERAYASDGPFATWLSRSGRALRAIADDYEGVDEEVAAGFDAKLPEGTAPRRRHFKDRSSETPGVDAAELTARLVDPHNIFDNGYNTWRKVVEGVSYVAGLDWVFDGLEYAAGRAGLQLFSSAYLKHVEAFLGYQWEAVGRVSSAAGSLESYFTTIEREMAASAQELTTQWSGHAADTCLTSIIAFDRANRYHQAGLGAMEYDLNNFAYGMRYITDFLLHAAEEGAVILFDLRATGETPWEVLKAGGKLLSRITAWAGVVILAIEALFAVVGAFGLAFGRRAYDLSVSADRVPAMPVPDVDGP